MKKLLSIMRYSLLIFMLLSMFASAHDVTLNIFKEEHQLMHVLEKELIDDNYQVRKTAYKKAETLTRHAMEHFIKLLEKKDDPELRYVAKLLKKKYFKVKSRHPNSRVYRYDSLKKASEEFSKAMKENHNIEKSIIIDKKVKSRERKLKQTIAILEQWILEGRLDQNKGIKYENNQ